jgi:HSP20 family protein
MADNRNERTQPTTGSTQSLQRRASTPSLGSFMLSPFSLVGQLMEDMDRMFDAFGGGRGLASGGRANRGFPSAAWAPAIEAFEKDGRFVVKADLPGLSPEDVRIDANDDSITISGERRFENEAEEGGVYRSERAYGRFSRTVPLPEGAKLDDAHARFDNGVLEISLPLPPQQQTKRRRIEIEGASPSRERGEEKRQPGERSEPAVH